MTSIFRVEEYAKQKNWENQETLKMDALYSSKMLVDFYRSTWRYIPKDRTSATIVRTSNTTATAVQLKNFWTIYGTGRAISCSQENATGPNPEPDKSRPSSNPVFFRSILVLPNLCLGLPSSLFSSGFPAEILYSCLFHVCYMKMRWTVSSSLIWSFEQYLERSTNYEAPRYTVFYNLLLFHSL